MSEIINNVHLGIYKVTEIASEFLVYQTDNRSFKSNDFQGMFWKLKDAWEASGDPKCKIGTSYLFELREIRNRDSHTAASDDYVSDPDFVARSLDTMRRFIELLLPHINRHRGAGHELLMPEFEYSLIQPEASRRQVRSELMLKSKTSEGIPVRRAAHDLAEAKVPVDKNTLPGLLRDLGLLQPEETALVVRTLGDVFRFDKYGEGYTGDWTANVKVDKVVVVHYNEGFAVDTAHVYIAEYIEKKIMTAYKTLRVRYHFKNIVSCGTINADSMRDFGSFLFIPESV